MATYLQPLPAIGPTSSFGTAALDKTTGVGVGFFVPPGASVAPDWWWNIGGLGGLRSFSLVLRLAGVAPPSTLVVYWNGAVSIVNNIPQGWSIGPSIWTSIATVAATTKWAWYTYQDTGVIYTSEGTGDDALGILNVPYLQFGISNTGAENVQGSLNFYGSVY